MNVCSFDGHIGKDAVLRKAGTRDVASFSVGHSERYGDKGTMWLNCSLFGDRAQKLSQYLTKGKFVIVTGSISQRTYEVNGETRHSLDLNVTDITFAPRSGGSQNDTQSRVNDDDDDADVPF